jgi:hypothetical protein
MAYMSSIPLNTEHMMEQINGKGTHTKAGALRSMRSTGHDAGRCVQGSIRSEAGNHCGKHSHTGIRLMGQVEIRSRVDALIKARERAVVASALTDRDKVLSKLRVWLEGTEVTDSNRLRAAELLGRSSGLFATDINVTTKRARFERSGG